MDENRKGNRIQTYIKNPHSPPSKMFLTHNQPPGQTNLTIRLPATNGLGIFPVENAQNCAFRLEISDIGMASLFMKFHGFHEFVNLSESPMF